MIASYNAEQTARIILASATCIATPTLLYVAYARWQRDVRDRLSTWRNGMAIAAMAIIAILWIFQSVQWILLTTNHDLSFYVSKAWMEFVLFLPTYFAYGALPLTLALKRSPRLFAVLAWVSLQLFYGSFVYV